jgi:hypothetical protein
MLIRLLLLAFGTGAAVFAQRGLTFHAGFDGGTDAKTAKGDKRLYTAPNYKAQSDATPGLGSPDIEIAKGAGKKGDALRFNKKNERAIFYKADKNVVFDAKNWTGTISFWLRLDPDKELAPGFCDPIQVTDKAYNDSAIWTDFTKDDNPRHFRLGVFGALSAWNPRDIPPDKNPAFNTRLVVVEKPPFKADKWTNVTITFSGLGSGKGRARLYVDGKSAGATPEITEKLEWDLSKAAIRLGVNYVGLFDEVSVYNRELSEAEVAALAK